MGLKMAGKIKIQLVKSTIGRKPDQVKTVHALGLNKISSYVILDSNPAILGMVQKINHLVKVEEI
jgi:large subunit ribosomal protein L30